MIRSIPVPIPSMRALLPMAALLALAIGCGSPSSARRADTVRDAGADSTRAIVLEMMRTLEREPLSAQAGSLRSRAFEWVATTSDLRDFDMDASILEPLENGVYPFNGELMMQFVFGMVLWRFSPEGAAEDRVAQVEAGLRSMIVAYRNILLADKKLTDPWLDRLDELRRLGRLRSFVEDLEARR